VQTYKYMTPYLNGLHMTIDGWRPGRDEEGWKLPASLLSDYEEDSGNPDDHSGSSVPTLVPRLHEDVAALLKLCESETSPWRRVRPKSTAAVMCGFGDASGTAFGATSQFQHSSDLHYAFGQWITSVAEEESSNWREFTNLVEHLEERGSKGLLDDLEAFMFTDNSTADAAFWKGSSKSKKLLGLVLRLRQLEMRTGMTLHVAHVSGKRMIAQGTDGLSRGDHSKGVMAGKAITTFVPLHLGAFERSQELQSWVEFILSDCSPKFLTPEGWFDQTNCTGTFVWAPPPAAADVVVERFGIARHKRPNTLHLLLIPRLMTGRWRKLLLKHVDFYCHVTWDPIWDLQEQFEPLTMFVALPYKTDCPRFVERASLVERFKRVLREEGLHETQPIAQRHLLRQLFSEAWSLSSM